MEAARQCIEQQCGEVRGAVAAAAGQIGPTEVWHSVNEFLSNQEMYACTDE